MWNKQSQDAPATEAPNLGNLAQAGTAMQDAPVAEPEPAPSKPAQKVKMPYELISPEAQAYTNQLVTNAVKEIFAQMAPLLQSIALTPEKLAAAEALRRAPTEDEVNKKNREAREKKLMIAEQEENRANLARNQSLCPHKYPTGSWAINVVNNYPDRQPRFLCSLCQSFFEPRRWVVGAPDADNPRGRAYIADAHKDYARVSEVLVSKGM